jgi:enhancing lycopene biosynthesis protein 2
MRGLQHLWVPSNVQRDGGLEAMCSRCGILASEAQALHVIETCTGAHPNERGAVIKEAAAIARQHASTSEALAQRYVRSANIFAQHRQAAKVALAIAKEIEALNGNQQPEPPPKNA